MQLAIDALAAGDPSTANNTYVRRTGLTNAGRLFAYETYIAELARQEPSSDRLQWGGQAHLASYVDVWQEYHAIADKVAGVLTSPGDHAAEIRSLKSKVRPVYRTLNRRLGAMAEVFDRATRDLRRATRLADWHDRGPSAAGLVSPLRRWVRHKRRAARSSLRRVGAWRTRRSERRICPVRTRPAASCVIYLQVEHN